MNILPQKPGKADFEGGFAAGRLNSYGDKQKERPAWEKAESYQENLQKRKFFLTE
jgi:hypothetical protein